MSTIAKGMITLSNVNDAYSVSLTPNSCVIQADYDGTNPTLTNAYTDISVFRGDVPHAFTPQVKSFTDGVKYTLTQISQYVYRLALTEISSESLSGEVVVTVQTEDEFVADVNFQFSVVRETSMLDWILDWESNKTVIGDTYLITPKIFVGKKVTTEEDMSALTGVYIGPDDTNGAGIYGYKESVDVFHINSDGAHIGGWIITQNGLQSINGRMQILSEGSITHKNESDMTMWQIKADGSGSMAGGNFTWDDSGNAEFKGKLTASEGTIGGWNITSDCLYSEHAVIYSNPGYFGVGGYDMGVSYAKPAAGGSLPEYTPPTRAEHITLVKKYGGVYMTYNNVSDYGIKGYLSQGLEGDADGKLAFSLGDTNQIASWNFDDSAIYIGTKVNMIQQYTAESGSVTIGTQGLRGYGWYIDNTGDVSFLAGAVKFTHDSGEIVGWKLNTNRFSNDNFAIVSTDTESGIYLSVADGANFNTKASASLATFINDNSGIYLRATTTHSELLSRQNGKTAFYLTSAANGLNVIGGWSFDTDSIFNGVKATEGFTQGSGMITMSTAGIRGFKWQLNSDGSGKIAGGNIEWDADGKVTFASSVTLSWTQCTDGSGNAMSAYLTKIGSDGIYTGTIKADNITSGTIKACTIQSSAKNPTWQLNSDGSGQFANSNIKWDKDGATEFTGKITANSGSIGGFAIASGYIGVETTASGTSFGNLSIYNDFFKVGGSNGYAMFGDDVIPATAGGAFTAVGRIVNQASNTASDYEFDVANYGLFINVSGGTKNYGISSNAALRAPAFITTQCMCLTFGGSPYSIDFSQYNVILMYYYDSNYSGAAVTLPNESSVAHQFGLSSLPTDFATIVLFRVRTGSMRITLKGIYNQDEDSHGYPMNPGDSLLVLITNADGFRYQLINYTC